VKSLFAVVAAVVTLAIGQGALCAERPAPEPAAAAAPAPPEKLDVNRATVEQLLAVPGVGPRMAQAIVDLRTSRGPFASLEDLLQVRGIKEKTLKSISPYLALVAVPAASPTSVR
jgi:competence protein ComEA